MKRIIMSLMGLLLIIGFGGCTHTVYVYPEQTFPELRAPAKVESKYESYIWQKCLYINDHNTSLCNDDLNKVITTVQQLRTNEETCSQVIDVYNEFIEIEKSQTRKEDEYSFWF